MSAGRAVGSIWTVCILKIDKKQVTILNLFALLSKNAQLLSLCVSSISALFQHRGLAALKKLAVITCLSELAEDFLTQTKKGDSLCQN